MTIIIKQSFILVTIVCVAILSGCKKAPPEHSWLKGEEYDRIDTLAKHLRGNDVVMWEVSYRHKQLWEAIVSDNFDYAAYQLDKIEAVMNHGKERRPKRAKSYEWFLSAAILPMRKSIENKADTINAYKSFTMNCVVCHSMEQVSFVPVSKYWELGIQQNK